MQSLIAGQRVYLDRQPWRAAYNVTSPQINLWEKVSWCYREGWWYRIAGMMRCMIPELFSAVTPAALDANL